MSDFTKSLLSGGQPDSPVYVYSRNNEETAARILRKEGLFAEPIARVEFTSAELDRQSIINFKLAKQLLQPQPHSPKEIPDLDVDGIFKEVEKQNLFLSLFIDRLNNPDIDSKSTPNSRFILEQSSRFYASLDGCVSPGRFEKLKANYSKNRDQGEVPEITLRQDDGAGNYKEFAKIIGLPEDADRLKTAVVKAIYDYEYTVKYLTASRGNPKPEAGASEPNPL